MTSYDIGEQARAEQESKRIGLKWNRLDWVGLGCGREEWGRGE